MRSRCEFPELLENLREAVRHLEILRSITPRDRDLIRLEEAFRERIVDLQRCESGYQESVSMAAN